ncbi:hypothetical protein SMSP2_00333 [Limihaloglobus sulfuriphilus]|uniref:Uncharacterized protein n=1 Tax=Limihaloglobus sulfuriphilus TaxID=1851148 RepID=A0A1Q2MBC5_9BACT|nr:hypothetical protein [Limihaloglobus sulfuriphilus]AQQ69996.1 hypothetical protein SMSP2_00333 [Limihaloglobus sulfuriphilus]
MIQCKDCELCDFKEGKGIVFRCNPFVNIKEPECLTKWQLMKTDHLIANMNMLLRSQQKLAPIQDKLIKFMEREIDDIEETDSWKYGTDENYDIEFNENDDWEDNEDEESF